MGSFSLSSARAGPGHGSRGPCTMSPTLGGSSSSAVACSGQKVSLGAEDLPWCDSELTLDLAPLSSGCLAGSFAGQAVGHAPSYGPRGARGLLAAPVPSPPFYRIFGLCVIPLPMAFHAWLRVPAQELSYVPPACPVLAFSVRSASGDQASLAPGLHAQPPAQSC